MRRSGRSGQRKERAIMIASSALVLTALTATGVYVRNTKTAEPDGGYTIDFSSLEDGIVAEDIPAKDKTPGYDPASAGASSSTVKNGSGKTGGLPSQTDSFDEKAEAIRIKGTSSNLILGEEETKDGETQEAAEEVAEAISDVPTEEAALETAAEATAAQIQPELTFSEADSLVMPLVGNVLINYSVDKSVYFPTLKQYRYNPAIVIAAKVGESVKAAAPGMVSRVYNDPITGQTVVMNLGNGYEVTYGQLKDVSVSEGTYVAAGEIFAQIAEPTRYYSVEGTNLYLKLTKDGVPVNPTA